MYVFQHDRQRWLAAQEHVFDPLLTAGGAWPLAGLTLAQGRHLGILAVPCPDHPYPPWRARPPRLSRSQIVFSTFRPRSFSHCRSLVGWFGSITGTFNSVRTIRLTIAAKSGGPIVSMGRTV